MCVGFLLQFNNNTKSATSALITNLCNAFNLLLKPDVLHGSNQTGFDNLIRNLGNYNLLLTAA
ncbi:hypothetical protein D3C81_1778990 [compost metagenome]